MILHPTHPLRVIISVLFCAGAAFHVAALRFPTISIPEPPAEHVVFAVVNFVWATIWLNSLEKRWWSVALTGALAGQQTIRHGVLVAEALPSIDVQSLLTIVWWWAVFAVMQLEREKRP